MKVILDTNFILTCIKERIDFLSQLEEQGFTILIPREVLQEMKDIRYKVSHDKRIAIDVAIKIFEDKRVKHISLGSRSVDDGLIKAGKEGHYIATLDRAIKREIPNGVVLFKSKSSVGIEKG